MSHPALGKIYVLVHAVVYFVSAVRGIKGELNLSFEKSCEKAKRFYGVASFFHHAVPDAINRQVSPSRSGPKMSSLQATLIQLLFGPPTSIRRHG